MRSKINLLNYTNTNMNCCLFLNNKLTKLNKSISIDLTNTIGELMHTFELDFNRYHR